MGFGVALICVAGILTQATLFLTLSAFGVTALIAASPLAFLVLKWIGAGFLIYLGIRGWRRAGQPQASDVPEAQQLYLRAFMIAAINPKSIAGYLAAFSQFVQPGIPVSTQMWVIMPTALGLTTLSYVSYCALGAGLGTHGAKRNVQYLFTAYFSSFFHHLRAFIRLISFFKRSIGYDDFRIL